MYELKKLDEIKSTCLNDFFKEIYILKREQIKKIVNKKRLKQAIMGEFMLKNLLQKENISYQNTDFEINKFGKPYIKDSSIFFNISHSYDYIIVVTSHKEIGVDIEKIRKTKENVWHQFATNKERDYIFSKEEEIEKRIFQIYCLKEAYFKMKGNNLSKAKNVEFILTAEKVICSDKNVHAYFIKDLKDYVVAVCEKIN